MSHEVESGFAVVDATGNDRARTTPWHGLGVQVPGVLTAKEALVTAGLDWDVELFPLTAQVTRQVHNRGPAHDTTEPLITTEVKQIEVPDNFAVVRDSDDALLGIVGNQYRPVQNAKAFEMFDNIVASGEAKYETAWSLRGGKIIAITARVPKTMHIAGLDSEAIETYLVLTTSHDGSKALTMAITPVRVVCMNTLNLALGRAKSEYRIKHTESADGKIAAAREALGLTFKYMEDFEAQAAEMVAATYTAADFEAMVQKLVPGKGAATGDHDHNQFTAADLSSITGTSAAVDASAQTRAALIGTLQSSTTIPDALRYTKWGAFNAVAEYADWIAPARASTKRTPQEQRTERALYGSSLKLKQKALALLSN